MKWDGNATWDNGVEWNVLAGEGSVTISGGQDAVDFADVGGSAIFGYGLIGVPDVLQMADTGGSALFSYVLAGVADDFQMVDSGGSVAIQQPGSTNLMGISDAVQYADLGGSATSNYTLGSTIDVLEFIDAGGSALVGYSMGGASDVVAYTDIGGNVSINYPLSNSIDALEFVDAGGAALFWYTLAGSADYTDFADSGGDPSITYHLLGNADNLEFVDIGGNALFSYTLGGQADAGVAADQGGLLNTSILAIYKLWSTKQYRVKRYVSSQVVKPNYDVYQKTSSESRDFDVPFDHLFTETDDFITSVMIEVDHPGLNIVGQFQYPDVNPRTTKVFVSGGVHQQAYKITAKALCESGRILENRIVLVVLD